MNSISCSLFKYEILCHYYVQSMRRSFLQTKSSQSSVLRDATAMRLNRGGATKGQTEVKDLRLNTPVRSRFCRAQSVHCKKRLAVFPSPDRMSLTKLPLAGNNLIIP
jgi:hypothetical protein